LFEAFGARKFSNRGQKEEEGEKKDPEGRTQEGKKFPFIPGDLRVSELRLFKYNLDKKRKHENKEWERLLGSTEG